MDRLLVSTRNPGKLAEFRELVSDLDLEILSPADWPDAPTVEEDAPDLAGNARKKAEVLFAHTGIPTLADDTGLEVEALGGAPGVHSARFAGPEADALANRRLLLARLEAHTSRKAQFRAVLAFVHGQECRFFEGICRGSIARREAGTGGFGYDRLFVPDGETRTFAELDAETKNAISHRGRALRAFRRYLSERD